MNTIPRHAQSVSRKPFDAAPKKRRVTVNTCVDNNLQMPSAQERAVLTANSRKLGTDFTPQQAREQMSALRNASTQDAKIIDKRTMPPPVVPPMPPIAPPVMQPVQTSTVKYDEIEHRVATKSENTSSHSERIILPSGCIFYNFNDITIQPFKPAALAKLFKATKNEDYMLFYDVINSTINVDIRDLWQIDARHILYWHKINSFPRTKFYYEWTSIYGNKNKTAIDYTNVATTPLSMKRERYLEWNNKGIQIPTVRDFEHYMSFKGKLEDDEKWLYDRAQFVLGNDDLHAKRARFENADNVDLIYDIKDFMNELTTGKIVESFQAKDVNFSHEAAIEKLSKEAPILAAILADESEVLSDDFRELLNEKKAITDSELIRLNACNSGEAEPMLETIPLELSVFEFFPQL